MHQNGESFMKELMKQRKDTEPNAQREAGANSVQLKYESTSQCALGLTARRCRGAHRWNALQDLQHLSLSFKRGISCNHGCGFQL